MLNVELTKKIRLVHSGAPLLGFIIQHGSFSATRCSPSPQACFKFRSWDGQDRWTLMRVAGHFETMFQHHNRHPNFLSLLQMEIFPGEGQFENGSSADRAIGSELLPGIRSSRLRQQELFWAGW